MRYKILIMVMCFFMIIFLGNVSAKNNTFPLIGKTIVIDAGHGGLDSGAISFNNYEKDLNLVISLNIKKKLEEIGTNVIMTREDDYDLSKPNALYRKKSDFDNRIIIINNSHADMYLSIHLNMYSSSKYHGPQVFYYPVVKQNEKIALKMQEELNKFSKTNRKVKINGSSYMYRRLNIPGILIECGFMSNYNELSNLKNNNYQSELSKVIVNGIISYFNS